MTEGDIIPKGKKRCECGYCNELINVLTVRGEPARFKKGHILKGKNHHNWKGGVNYKEGKHKGYRLILRPNHPRANSNGYVPEHVLVMEAKLNRQLLADEDVHHINKNVQDNRPENLTVLTHGGHTSHHMKGNQHGRFRAIDMNTRTCYYCGGLTPLKQAAKPQFSPYYQWYKLNGQLACQKCYQRDLYHRNKKKIQQNS